MNSLRMYVEGATGDKHLFTLAANRDGQEASFRKHARWWINGGYKHSPVEKWPCMPARIVVEPYQDDTSP